MKNIHAAAKFLICSMIVGSAAFVPAALYQLAEANDLKVTGFAKESVPSADEAPKDQTVQSRSDESVGCQSSLPGAPLE